MRGEAIEWINEIFNVTFLSNKYLNPFFFIQLSCPFPHHRHCVRRLPLQLSTPKCLLFVAPYLPPPFVLHPIQMAHLQPEVAAIGVLRVRRRLTGAFLPKSSGGKSQMVSAIRTLTRSRRIATVATTTSSLSRYPWA